MLPPIWHHLNVQEPLCPPSLLASRKRLCEVRVLTVFLMYDLDETFREASEGCFLSSDTTSRNLHVLQDSMKRLKRHGGSWQHWKWCQGVRTTPRKLPWKFHYNQTSWTLSRLSMSFKSLPGVLEDMEVPDNIGNGVRGLGQPLGSFP